jgi:hypothetical protein
MSELAEEPMPIGYTPGDESDRDLALFGIRLAMRRLGCLEVVGSKLDGSVREMLKFRVKSKHANLAAESIEADIRTIWDREVVGSSLSICRVEPSELGFNFRFALLHAHRTFVTGVIVVEL